MRAFAARALVPPPFPPGSHVDAQGLAEAALSWANTIGLTSTPAGLDRLRRAQAAELAARACPDAPYDRVLLLAELVTWLFAFDDRCDEDELGTDPGRLAPVITPLLDTLDQLGSRSPSRSERPPRSGRPVPPVARWTARRPCCGSHTCPLPVVLLWSVQPPARVPCCRTPDAPHTGAVLPSLTLTDLVRDGFPGSRDRVRPAVARLDLLAADLVCWCNDVFSYGKELGHGGHNLAAVIAADTGCGEGAALEEAAARFNAGLDAYARLEAEVLDDADPTLARMVDARRRWLRGTYDWSMGADRYV